MASGMSDPPGKKESGVFSPPGGSEGTSGVGSENTPPIKITSVVVGGGT